MQDDVTVRVLRLSFVSFASGFDLVGHPTPKEAPLRRLADAALYRATFEEALAGQQPNGLEVPWPGTSSKNFWRLCLGYGRKQDPDDVWRPGAQRARRHLVPLRGPSPLAADIIDLPGRIKTEAFYYPFGVSLVCTVTLRPDCGLLESVEIAHRVRRDPIFSPTQADWKPPGPRTLDQIAHYALGRARRQLLGVEGEVDAANPFSIATFIKVDGTSGSTAVENRDEVHRALDALAGWSADWKENSLPPLAEQAVKIMQGPDGHKIYGRRRGRAVWLPARHRAPAAKPYLACLHRNLTLATMHTEALMSFTAECVRARDEGTMLSPLQYECRDFATGLLVRLYQGVDTYKSGSVRRQIERDPRKEQINTVRHELHAKPI